MAEETMHVTVTGLVQGVGYRWFAQRRAEAFNVRGYARNRADGSVEVVAQGERSALEAFLGELRIGPRSSQVRKTTVTWTASDTFYDSFEVG